MIRWNGDEIDHGELVLNFSVDGGVAKNWLGAWYASLGCHKLDEIEQINYFIQNSFNNKLPTKFGIDALCIRI